MKSILLSVILLFINVSCFGTMTEKEETDKMVFIRIKLIEGNPSGISYEVLPGKIKTPKVKNYKPDDIFYEVTGSDDSIIAEGTVDDLSNRKYEYVNEKGELNTVDVKHDSTEIVVRVNYNKKISKINLFKIPGDNSLKKSKEQFIPLGSFTINLN